MKKYFSFAIALVILSSCSLTSTTFIKANDSFLLGQNEHGKFSVVVKNTSPNEIKIWKMPINGGQHSLLVLKPLEKTKIKVESNTALSFNNESDKDGTVELKVTGDTGLSMGYKNQN